MILPKSAVQDVKVWLRVNTDFLFQLLSSIQHDSGDIFEYLTSEGIFTRLRVGGRWIVRLGDNNELHGFDSFTHAFIFYRRYQRRHGISPKVYVDGGHTVEESGELIADLPTVVELDKFDQYLSL